MNVQEIGLWGCLGGILPDVLRLVGDRHHGAPAYLRQWFFWFSLLLLIGVAGLATYLLSPSRIIDAVAIGFSAPETLSNARGSKKPRAIRGASVGRRSTNDSMTHLETRRGAGEYDGETVQEWTRERIAQLRLWWAN
jgi:hypothetical protein